MSHITFVGFDFTKLTSGQTLIYAGNDAWTGVTLSSNNIGLGIPTDGSYSDGLLTFTDTTNVADAVDGMNEILSKLAPAKPSNLSVVGLTAKNTNYTALEAGTAVSQICYDVSLYSRPEFYANQFYDGDSGTLSIYIDGVLSGSTVIQGTPYINTGTTGSLIVYGNADHWLGTAGKEGFWRNLSASGKTSVAYAASATAHQYVMSHSDTGYASSHTFYIDNPGAVTFSNISYSVTETTPSYISGVPGLRNAATTVFFYYTVVNSVGYHYLNAISNVQGGTFATISKTPGSTPNNGDSINFTASTTLNAVYQEPITYTMYAVNSKGTSFNSANSTNWRIDKISSETRKTSGVGQYPAVYGSTYNSAELITGATSASSDYSDELQLLNGLYQRPAAVNYSTYYPVGPDYSIGMGTHDRYVTFDMGAISSLANFILTLNGATGTWAMNGSKETTGISIYVRITGTNATNGWIDANKAYISGFPTNDGDAAMNSSYVSVSTTVKQVTFGTFGPRSGNLWVRIGLPSGSNKKFTSVTRS